MSLSTLDIIIIAAYFLLSLIIGVALTKRAGKSMNDFFLGGRSLPWWIAGTSMVATTFAADTPLAVNELVATKGIAGNWLWWSFVFGGMLTVFFFAKLWRRANILTDVEFIELRYSGKSAAFLRGFRAIYLGGFMNAVIIGWVNVALISILEIFFNIPSDRALLYVAGAMVITVLYSSLSGLLGVAVTDAVQFIIAMTGCIVLAVIVVNSEKIGGIAGLKAKLPSGTLDFFPHIHVKSGGSEIGTTLSLGLGSFLAYIGIQWWSSWYPGAEPGGGGYVAQRMMSAKNEKHAVISVLFFQIAHYCLRPWPWILVGLCTIILYPELGMDDKKAGYVMAMKDFLPDGFKGLLITAFLAAYMSTIATQLNWGASYVVNDFYNRFLNKHHSEKKLVAASRIATVIMMLFGLFATTLINSISGVWQFIMECGAGLGLVLILRWYWWRINAWSEIAATIAPFIAFAISKWIFNMEFPESFFLTVGFTTFAWLLVTFLTKPTAKEKLEKFYLNIRPGGWWGPVRNNLNFPSHGQKSWGLILCWLTSVLMIYAILFAGGKLIFAEYADFMLWAIIALASGTALAFLVRKTEIFQKSMPLSIQENRSLKPYNTFGIEVPARHFVEITSTEDLKELFQNSKWQKEGHLILGGGSNILFTKDFEGIVIKNGIRGIRVESENDREVVVTAGAGESWHDLVMYCVDKGYGGIENLSLIPGTVGAAPIQNIGAYGVELKDTFKQLKAFNILERTIETFDREACRFGYRDSIFKTSLKGQYFITEVTLRLSKNPIVNTSYGAISQTLEEQGITQPSIKDVSRAVIRIRRSKLPDPSEIGNAGSFFKNPEISGKDFEGLKEKFPDIPSYPGSNGTVKIAAGWLIEQCGLKGYRKDYAGIHEKQALVLLNFGNAQGSDILALAEKVKSEVQNKFGVGLTNEVNIV